MVTCLAYCLDKELWKALEYLKEQVRVCLSNDNGTTLDLDTALPLK